MPTVIYLQPPNGLFFQVESEYVYFKAFQERAAPELAGYFDTNLWNRTILQVCHQEEFARHAVVALGALHTTMDLVQNNGQPSEIQRKLGQTHHQLALQHYGKALELLRRLPQKIDESSLRIILLSCLLTTCFENYIGNQDNALVAAYKGVEILNEYVSSKEWSRDYSTMIQNFLRVLDDEDSDLISTFARLGASILIFDQGRIKIPRKFLPLQLQRLPRFPESPDRFESVREARIYCDMLLKKTMMWRDATSQLQGANLSTIEFGESDPIVRAEKVDLFSKKTQTELESCVKETARWIQAFQPLFTATRKYPGSKEFRGASVLMIQFNSFKLCTDRPYPIGFERPSEMCFDEHLEDMIQSIDLARELLETYAIMTSRKSVYMFDDGVVMGIFFVATRCRDCVVRRKAIQLLVRYPRREGLWDSMMAARVATWMMNLEEEGLIDGVVPETSRLSIARLDPNLAERKVIVRCSRLDKDTRKRVELSDVTLTW
ncbi:hypothetical protein EG329_002595 [Mollisiaceae sp. DMI_Dod_QoI]|nr:hypothetical protein EG329_002595 [Helotiales sp. DMI_Dod_QoI]